MLMLFGLVGLAGCGRKDVPDYPPDVIERPGTVRGQREPVRY